MNGQEFFDATALPFVLAEEGGYNPNDPSMRGITQVTYNAYRDRNGLPRQDVRLISDDDVYAIYREDFWRDGGAESIADSGDFPLALVHFDAGVNQGTGAARTMLSQASGDPEAYLTVREERYRALAQAQPAKHAADLPVWLQRLADLRGAVAGMSGTTGGAAVLLSLMLAGVWMITHARRTQRAG